MTPLVGRLEKIAKEFVTSLVTIVIAILAIAIFISSGSTIIFYVTVFIAIVIGLYNVWLISTVGSRNERARPAGRGRPKGRKR